jgi:hypothetical protein
VITTLSGSALFTWLIIRLFQLVFSVRTMFFSHNKSTNSVFQPAYQHNRTGPPALAQAQENSCSLVCLLLYEHVQAQNITSVSKQGKYWINVHILILSVFMYLTSVFPFLLYIIHINFVTTRFAWDSFILICFIRRRNIYKWHGTCISLFGTRIKLNVDIHISRL